MGKINKVLKKYLKYNRLFCIVNIKDNVTIKKGLIISTGWNLGKKIKSSHLFEPFVSSKYGGSGLGLSIVSSIIEEHGGIIEVNSIGQTIFTVLLPSFEGNSNG